MSKKKGDRAKLTRTDEEWVCQTYALTGNKSRTARMCGVALQTVNNVLKRREEQDDLPTKEARAEAVAKLASKTHARAEELLDSITPEDLDSGRIPITDKDGKIIGYKTYGPSLLQKATAFGIVTDKANVIQAYEKGLLADVHSGKLMAPDDIQGLVGAIQGKLKEIKILNVQFENENPDLVRQTQDLVAEVDALEAREAAKPEIDAFDGLSDD